MVDSPHVDGLPALLTRGLELAERRLRESGGAPIYDSILAQLRFMSEVVSAGSAPTDADLNRLTLGVYAAREFESSDPEFADVLFEAEYRFKRL